MATFLFGTKKMPHSHALSKFLYFAYPCQPVKGEGIIGLSSALVAEVAETLVSLAGASDALFGSLLGVALAAVGD